MDWAGTLHSQALVIVTTAGVVSAAPAWMTSRPDTRIQVSPDRLSYAFLPYGEQAVNCSQHVDVVAPDGTTCGTLSYPIAAGSCDTRDMAMGEDGTILQPLPSAMEQVTPPDAPVYGHTCTWRFWRNAVR